MTVSLNELRERLQERAEGTLIISKHPDGTETVWCGDEDGVYRGWVERSLADNHGWDYRGPGDDLAAAALAEIDALVARVEQAERERDEAREEVVASAEALASQRIVREWYEELYLLHKPRADRYEKAIKEALHEAPDSPHSWRLVKKHLSAALAGEDA